jgi:spore coat protein U-like protein
MKSMFTLKNTQRALIAAGLIAATTGAFASSTVTTSFQVQANVNAQCSITAVNLTFPAVDPLSSQTDGATTVSVKCTKNSAYTVGLNAGTTTGSTIAQRLMANGADTMDYNLYTDAGRASVWGNSAGSWVSGTGAGMGTAQVLNVYGRVAAGQTNLAVGTFTEPTVTVTVTY